MRKQHAFRRDTIRTMFVHRTIVTSLFVRFSVAATPAGTLSPARELNSATRKRRRIGLTNPHIPITVLYTLQLLLVSPRTRILQEKLARTQANWLASNQSLSRYGNKSAYCWAPDRAEPGLLWVPEPGYSYLDSSRLTKTGRQLSRYRISEYSKGRTPKRYLTDAIGIYDVMENGPSELPCSRIE